MLAAADPAQPYGAVLPWPKRAGARAARVAGAYVVLLGGEPALFVERGGRSLVPLRDPDEEWLRVALAALVEHARRFTRKRLAVERFDGEPVGESAVLPLLVEAGFLAGPAAPCFVPSGTAARAASRRRRAARSPARTRCGCRSAASRPRCRVPGGTGRRGVRAARERRARRARRRPATSGDRRFSAAQTRPKTAPFAEWIRNPTGRQRWPRVTPFPRRAMSE